MTTFHFLYLKKVLESDPKLTNEERHKKLIELDKTLTREDAAHLIELHQDSERGWVNLSVQEIVDYARKGPPILTQA